MSQPQLFAEPAPVPVPRLWLTVAYDGTRFHGVAPQPGVRTVGGEVARALAVIARLPAPPLVVVAGRTDAGVHAWGQEMHVDLSGVDAATLDLDRVARSVGKLLGPEVVVRALRWAPEGFDARHSARWRRYRYTIRTGLVPSPFDAAFAWHVPEALDLACLRLASDALIGEHDFTSFCRTVIGREGTPRSNIRTVLDAQWGEQGDLLVFEIRATAFCQQMVRAIVGFLVEVGRGRRHAGELLGVLAARRRSAAAPIAPAHGLCLWDVGY